MKRKMRGKRMQNRFSVWSRFCKSKKKTVNSRGKCLPFTAPMRTGMINER